MLHHNFHCKTGVKARSMEEDQQVESAAGGTQNGPVQNKLTNVQLFHIWKYTLSMWEYIHGELPTEKLRKS